MSKKSKQFQFFCNEIYNKNLLCKFLFLFQGNYQKGKLQTLPLSECLEQHAIEAAGLASDTEATPFKAVVSEKQTLVNSDSAIVYVDDHHQVRYGIYTKIIQLVLIYTTSCFQVFGINLINVVNAKS